MIGGGSYNSTRNKCFAGNYILHITTVYILLFFFLFSSLVHLINFFLAKLGSGSSGLGFFFTQYQIVNWEGGLSNYCIRHYTVGN